MGDAADKSQPTHHHPPSIPTTFTSTHPPPPLHLFVEHAEEVDHSDGPEGAVTQLVGLTSKVLRGREGGGGRGGTQVETRK